MVRTIMGGQPAARYLLMAGASAKATAVTEKMIAAAEVAIKKGGGKNSPS